MKFELLINYRFYENKNIEFQQNFNISYIQFNCVFKLIFRLNFIKTRFFFYFIYFILYI